MSWASVAPLMEMFDMATHSIVAKEATWNVYN